MPIEFRNEALRHLKSPEAMDELIVVTTRRSWLLFVLALFLFGVVILWTVFDTIPIRVKGLGVYLMSGPLNSAHLDANTQEQVLVEVYAPYDGLVEAVHVRDGQQVEMGQLLMTLSLPALETVIRDTETERNTLAVSNKKIDQVSIDLDKRFMSLLESDINAIKQANSSLEKQIGALKKSGVVPSGSALDWKLPSLQTEQKQNQIRLDELHVRQLSYHESAAIKQLEAQERVQLLQDRLAFLKNEYRLKSELRAPVAGVVLQIGSTVTSSVTAGLPLVILSPPGDLKKDLYVNAYFSSEDGKRIRKSMDVEIVPRVGGYYSHMMGRVSDVSPLPATVGALNNTLKIRSLVDEITRRFVIPLHVVISPERNIAEPSGYSWYPRSPKVPPAVGTLADVFVIIDRIRPLYYAFPFLEQWVEGTSP